jgi:hypothetical protein
VAYDIRFELYDGTTLDRIVHVGIRAGDWDRSLNRYSVVIVDGRLDVEALASEQGTRVVYRDEEVAVLARSGQRRAT